MQTPPTSRILFRAFLLSAAITLLGLPAAVAAEKPVKLFDGNNFDGWRKPTGTWSVVGEVSQDPGGAEKFIVKPGTGIALNSATNKTVDLITEGEFGDMHLHIEFNVAKHSNSGVYLMGRYEMQIYDSFGIEKDKYPGIECGGIYPRWIDKKDVEGHSPTVNASKPAGQWQTFDITFRAPRFDAAGKKTENAKIVKFVHNEKVIHENVELNGPTRGPMWEDEKPTGPIRLQGDHGPVAFRNIWLEKLDLK